ncbi:MAG: SDR family NAD(P)-dependent oxidoreductase [Vicinamibacterales bacterium]
MSDSAIRLNELSAIKLALMARRVRAESHAVLDADPIAIIGMACRVPGGGDTPERFWEVMSTGTDAVREIPRDRWPIDDWYDPDPAAPARSIVKCGGFLESVDGFDAGFFGIVPREAERMDPQQRLLLEVATEALDDAGFSRAHLAQTRAGVYIASYHNDYAQLQYRDWETIDARTLTGTLHSVIANRLSYLLDLRGPSISVDTACSSSLVAVHLACQSLRAGETDMAVAGGVSVMAAPDLFVSMSKVGFMAPDGRCKTFDTRADGFGRGEGCGVIVLKRLADAVADGDRVLAVVRGSAVNQDGHSTLMAAPNGLAQQAMLRGALANAQVAPQRIGFVETHGTGTALGDPIEVEALAAVIGTGERPCYLGSVKANIGHLEAAAGVVGLIKTVLVFQHEAVPKQLHFTKLNPHISLAGTRLAIPTTLVPWPVGSEPRCAGVSSFGVGGTNAHVILEEAPRFPSPERQSGDAVPCMLPLSAHDPFALRDLAHTWVGFLADASADVVDICYTAAARRTHYAHRLAVVGRNRHELAANLAEWLQTEPHTGGAEGRLGFVFSGQGPQWYAMGRELLAEEPVFRETIEEVDAILRPLSGWSLLEELAADESDSRLDQTEVAQPALFAIQVGLAALWRDWGITPDGVVGHSVGEIAALHVAGVLSLADAVRVVWNRGHIMQQATGLGRMASVAVSEEDAAALVRAYGDRLSIGAVNGPRSVVLSGESTALAEVLNELTARGVHHKMLPVQYAFHSAQMAPFQRRLADALRDVPFADTRVAFYSTVTGADASRARVDADYVARNVRAAVRFASAVSAMIADGFEQFLEIAPHPVLSTSISECAERVGRPVCVHSSLRRTKPERETLLRACAGLYVAGRTPDWSACQPESAQMVTLPAYQWQRRRFWLAPAASPAHARHVTTSHPLLGEHITVAGKQTHVFTGNSSVARGWLNDHRVFGQVIVPGAAMLEALHAAAGIALAVGEPLLSGFATHRPLIVPDDREARWQVVVTADGPGLVRAELHHRQDDDWQLVASVQGSATERGATGKEHSAPVPENSGAGASPNVSVDASAVYQRFANLGVEFGPTFRLLHEIRRGDNIATARVSVPGAVSPQEHALHPALLDAGLQLCSIAAARGPHGELPASVMLPIGIDRFRVVRPMDQPTNIRVRVQQGRTLAADIVFSDAMGNTVALLEGARFAPADAGLLPATSSDQWLYETVWQPASEASTKTDPRGSWLVYEDGDGVGAQLALALEAIGASCLRVSPGGQTPAQLPPLRGIVHLRNLDIASLDTSVAADDEDRVGLASVLQIVQAGAPSAPLWIVTRGAHRVAGHEPVTSLRPRAAGAWGLASVIAAEQPERHVRCIDLDPSRTDGDGLIEELLSDGPARVALRGGVRWEPRLERYRSPVVGVPQQLELVRPGTLDGVELRALTRRPLAPHEVRLRVLATGINFRDVLQTLAMYPGAPAAIGVECAGVVTERGHAVHDLSVGSRVFGFAPASLATEVTVPAAFLAPVPSDLSDEQAAGIPVAFLTAYYGLHRLAGLRRGDKVLVHAAAGGVGLAAVQLALRLGAEVFATAGSPEKREFIRALGVEHVMDSRSLAFADQIREITAGRGVDVVLNSLAGEFIPASLDVLAEGGRFLELGKRDILTVETAADRRPDVRYHAYDLGADALADHGLMRPMMNDIIAALADGSVKPLPVTTYPLAQVSDAFRLMARAGHIGKIVIRVARTSRTTTESLVTPDGTYLITGGLGYLGLQTAHWLASKGARHVVLVGRRPPTAANLETIQSLGISIRTVEADSGDRTAMTDLIGELAHSLRGVIHAAGVTEDGVLVNQTWERCSRVLHGKAHGAFLLHELTRDLPLDFFVLYSAAGLVLGASGQGVYPAANAELDSLAHARRAAGLPALSVGWGLWAGGMAGTTQGVWESRGLSPIEPAHGFAQLERLLREDATYALVLPIDWRRFLSQLPSGVDRRMFAAFAQSSTSTASSPTRPTVADHLGTRLAGLPAGQRREALLSHLADRALQVIGLAADTSVNPAAPLKQLGLDSLMAVELRNMLTRSIGKPLPVTVLFDYPTLDALADHLAHVMNLDLATTPSPSTPTASRVQPGPSRSEVHSLSDEEAEAMLLAELDGSHDN